MGLDYSKGCVNLRDVGEWVNHIAGRPLLREGLILRGGKLDFVAAAADLGHPGTIICLRKGTDPVHLLHGADYWHFPISNDYEKYETTRPEVRSWLRAILGTLASNVSRYPILLHCTSGKDRTGVVVACLLHTLGIDRQIIVEEYLLSDGEVMREWIETALDGIEHRQGYLHGVDLAALRDRFLVPET